MFLLLLLIIGLTGGINYGQISPGARQISLSHSDLASGTDAFFIFNNSAGIANIKEREAAIFYSPAPFGLKEMATGNLAYVEPFSFGSVALGGMYYGFNLYKEVKISAAVSYKFNNLSIGSTLNYHTVKIDRYGSDGSAYIDIGMILKLTEEINWGVSLQNVNRASFGKEKNQIPVIYLTGIAARITPGFSLYLAVGKELKYKPEIKVGFEYDIVEYLTIRSGFNNYPSSYSAGIGINYNKLSLDYSFFTHQDLGITHQAGLRIRFMK
jgi:hypothetical protein